MAGRATTVRLLRGAAAATLVLTTALVGASGPGTAQEPASSSGIRYVPDVLSQFNAIPDRPDAIGWHLPAGPEPTQCKHWQGIARSQQPGVPYLFVTRSGNNTPACPFDTSGDAPGDLSVIRMASRDATGERLRSNRLERDTDIVDTAPDAADQRVAVFRFDGSPIAGDDDGDVWPPYHHPGGVHLVGDVLVVALENPTQSGVPANLIAFFDVSDPQQPTLISEFDPGTASDFSAGLVTVAPQPDGRHLMLVTGGPNRLLRLFTSSASPLGLRDDALTWEPFEDVTESVLEASLGGIDWPSGGAPFGDAHQMLNFVREGGPSGPLFLIGARNSNSGAPLADDFIDLYAVHLTSSTFRLERVASRHLDTHPNLTDGTLGSGNIANLAAGSGTYISPSGELIFYATEHDNTGPGGNTVNAGEWRHIDMVRPGSPTLDPAATPGGPYAVAEGSTLALAGSGAPPVTAAWVELFADPGFDDRFAVIDYRDFALDSWDDFDQLDGETTDPDNFSDDPSSVRWFAPQSCTIRLNDDDYADDDFPGDNVLTLSSEGPPGAVPPILTWPGLDPVTFPLTGPRALSNLGDVSNNARDDDMNSSITSVTFLPDCDAYYTAAMALTWDLDGDGTFEASGSSPTFSAAGLDGPSSPPVALRATHPADGRTGTAVTTVRVENVAPTVDAADAFDPTGAEIGVDVPVALVGLPVQVLASFTDPGTPDTQVAQIEWGDGTVEGSDDFDAFADAFGGRVGLVDHTHAFAAPGTYEIRLTVTDDDGGASLVVLPVEVLSVEQALGSVVARIDELLAGSLAPAVRRALERARADLDGQRAGAGEDGALDELDRSNLVAALRRIQAAVEELDASGLQPASELDGLLDLLGLAAYSLAQQTYAAAVAATVPTSPQAVRLAGVAELLELGRARLAADEHAAAVLSFTDATIGALPLCACT